MIPWVPYKSPRQEDLLSPEATKMTKVDYPGTILSSTVFHQIYGGGWGAVSRAEFRPGGGVHRFRMWRIRVGCQFHEQPDVRSGAGGTDGTGWGIRRIPTQDRTMREGRRLRQDRGEGEEGMGRV